MSVFRDPSPSVLAAANGVRDPNSVRDAANAVLDAVHFEFERRQALVDRGDPLTALERLELSALCAALADAFDRSADIWDTSGQELPVAIRCRKRARDLRDAASLHEAVAGLAPPERVRAE